MSSLLLPFSPDCAVGILIKRTKRFIIDFTLEGKPCLAHTNNSGSMLGLVQEGLPILVSPAATPGRKLPYTLEMIQCTPGDEASWVGVNTLTPNRLLRAAFEAGLLPWAKGYTGYKPEAKRGESRLDALLTGPGMPPLWVECKNVTLVEDTMAAFPDAQTVRGQKHLREMKAIVDAGERAAFFYCIQRHDALCFGPADYIDPTYAALYHEGLLAGVEVYPYQAELSLEGIGLGPVLPLAPVPCYRTLAEGRSPC